MYLGIDVGSVSTDAVLIDDHSAIVGFSIVKSGFDHKRAIDHAVEKVCENTGIHKNDIVRIVGTGYGRRNVTGVSKVFTEISCHGMGINYFFPEVRTVIDIGGQDSKVIHVNADGFVENFIMNDRCAAGTGRFLDVMANAMDIHVHELGLLSLKAKKVESISSICTVFAESEVISKITEGRPKEDIIAGIHQAICERLMGMVDSIGMREPVAITGGVAKNAGIVKAFSDYSKIPIHIPDEPQITGALGAAIFAKNSG